MNKKEKVDFIKSMESYITKKQLREYMYNLTC